MPVVTMWIINGELDGEFYRDPCYCIIYSWCVYFHLLSFADWFLTLMRRYCFSVRRSIFDWRKSVTFNLMKLNEASPNEQLVCKNFLFILHCINVVASNSVGTDTHCWLVFHIDSYAVWLQSSWKPELVRIETPSTLPIYKGRDARLVCWHSILPTVLSTGK